MPANLSPDYMAAERKYKEAKDADEKLRCLEEMYATIPKHKGTEKMQADIKHKISSLKEHIEDARQRGKKGFSYRIPREGCGQVVLVGAPNSGKSSILKALSNAEPVIAPYPYTTHTPLPGMVPYKDVKMQMIDLPPISETHTEHWLSDLIKAADVIICVVNMQADDPIEEFNEVRRVLENFKIALVNNKDECAQNYDFRFLRKKTLLAASKVDSHEQLEIFEIFKEMLDVKFDVLPISVEKGIGLDVFSETAYKYLNKIRIYSKAPGKPADMNSPFTIPSGSTLIDFAQTVHQDFAQNLKFARIWGSGRFDGQQISHDFVLHDGDIVELHI